ncbi:GntR family transcriptional regulator [Actinacidiphila rubida]|uniref:Transcriptional regulator, GntR family n=1 Tax=Actinacidiphila rubida TaxID=310780 RepID=A0A1H8P405_9ACTN|nr:GntR family transcriptional regulator [Actinacidiphila rubida]SEO36524.1 transcriptional regulator, GntR family [Actinacidiphila rubida]
MNEEEQVSPPSDQPPYLHIADVLRGEIEDGVFPIGERLPSQAELEKRFDVSRPTVQRALTALRKDGYIDNQRGRSAEVLHWRRTAGTQPSGWGTPGPTFAVLDSEITAAFEAEDITIDVYSLSAETLNTALAVPLNRVLRRELTPASIRMRLVLPSLDARLAIPRLVEGDSDWPLQRLRALVRAQTVSLDSAFNQITQQPDLPVRSSLEVRTVPVTPLHKLYVLNGSTVLTGHYQVLPREVAWGVHRGEIYDVLGIGAVLFPYRADPEHSDSHSSRFVSESRDWFESLWSNIAEPMKLDE